MDFKQIKEIDSQHFMRTGNRQQVAFVSGKGCKLYDDKGREYTDFLAGVAVNSLGYSDPELTQAIAVQAAKLIHVSNHFYTEEQAQLTELLLNGSDFSKAFFCNSGAEANEAAIKLARKYFYNYGGTRTTVLTADNSFHGRTLATVTATGQPKYSQPFAPLPEGFRHIPFNDLDGVKAALTDDVGAVMLETIQGEGGVRPVSKEYLAAVAKICKQKNIILIFDEIQTGMGRTGKLYSYEHYGIVPDVVTLAKGLGGGVPVGAVLARGDVAEAFVPGDHGTTFGGNPLACKAASVVLKRLKNTGLLAQVAETGKYLAGKLNELKKRSPHVKEARGTGLLQGIELENTLNGGEIVGKMLGMGYIINCCGDNTLRFCPPLIIGRKEIDGMIAALASVINSE